MASNTSDSLILKHAYAGLDRLALNGKWEDRAKNSTENSPCSDTWCECLSRRQNIFFKQHTGQIIYFFGHLQQIIFFLGCRRQIIFFKKIPAPPPISNGPSLTFNLKYLFIHTFDAQEPCHT